MTGLDKRHTGNADQGPEPAARPLFPGAPAGRPGTAPPQEAPLTAPTAQQQQVPPPRGVLSSGPNALPMTLHGSSGDLTAPVEGRITIGDTVIEKIAALAALEVDGVAALTAQGESAGNVRVVRKDGDEVVIDVAIAVQYGIVIRDVAKVVKANVARVAGMMLGMRVAAVNVSVEDVRHAGAGQAPARA
ncbi:Asp23/Gls24 family envelope stress response protein [Actinomadura darangshiensis]|uniref:Asp23/Gls24 family envelope stress response protein n=1 Tax=Actinomadura darangshiensis TaxID=705336 RepID=A0A4R5BM09_9ACTN|nr:Asp23/Gls24 family envelope stress response protein [Actinomadura darangshiensis]TDD86336.1 Asp23/Gls24 family envelope stress response protein [Actinomadura darangshiensis]